MKTKKPTGSNHGSNGKGGSNGKDEGKKPVQLVNGAGPTAAPPSEEPASPQGNVIDFSARRADRSAADRRQTERFFLRELVQTFAMIGDDSERAIEVIEASETGIGFRIPYEKRNPFTEALGELTIRLYFGSDTWLPLGLKIVNVQDQVEEGRRYVRYGCSIDQSFTSYGAYLQFIRFIELYLRHARRDRKEAVGL